MNLQRLFCGVHVSRRTHYTRIETHYLHTAACVCILMATELAHYNMSGPDYPDRDGTFSDKRTYSRDVQGLCTGKMS